MSDSDDELFIRVDWEEVEPDYSFWDDWEAEDDQGSGVS
jgi:hypothetical protein